jgi:hypothetical protein
MKVEFVVENLFRTADVVVLPDHYTEDDIQEAYDVWYTALNGETGTFISDSQDWTILETVEQDFDAQIAQDVQRDMVM